MRAVRFKGKTYACNKFSWWLKRPLYLLFGFSRNRFQHFEIMFLTTSCLQPKSMCLAKWFGIGSKEYHIFPISVCATSICLFVWRGCKTADLCDVAANLLICVTWLRNCWFVWRGCETADFCDVAAKLPSGDKSSEGKGFCYFLQYLGCAAKWYVANISAGKSNSTPNLPRVLD